MIKMINGDVEWLVFKLGLALNHSLSSSLSKSLLPDHQKGRHVQDFEFETIQNTQPRILISFSQKWNVHIEFQRKGDTIKLRW